MNPILGEDVTNDITVNFVAREIGSSTSVIWSSPSLPFLVKQHTQRIVNARYLDPNNDANRMGAKDILPLVRGTDFTANVNVDGSGNDLSDSITVSVNPTATSAKVIIDNSSNFDVYITALQLRGTPMIYHDDSVQSVDADSIASNDRHPKVLEVRSLDNADLALQFANYTVSKFKDPLLRMESVTFNTLNSPEAMAASLSIMIGDKIGIVEDATGHNSVYIVVGQQRSLTVGGDHPCDVTWILKPAERETFWKLDTVGKSELGLTTRLAF
jgi:hypothetical protein